MRSAAQIRATLIACSVTLLATFCAWGQPVPAITPPSTDNHNFSVSGTVVNSVTGEPIRRVLVQVADKAILTDYDGRFELHDVQGVATLAVTKPGYFGENQLGFGGLPRTIGLASGLQVKPDSSPLLIRLIPAGSITGRVTGENNESLEDFRVQLLASSVQNGRRVWRGGVNTETDENGEFSLADIQPGTYKIAVLPPDAEEGSSSYDTGGYPLRWFYSGTADRSAAAALEITPGRDLRADVSMRKQPVFRIAGTVVGSTTPGVALQLAGLDGEKLSAKSKHDSRTGTFEFPEVPSGDYAIIASAEDNAGRTHSTQTILHLTKNTEHVVVSLESYDIPVHVTKEFAEREPGERELEGISASAAAIPKQLPIQVRLEETDPPSRQALTSYEGTPEQPLAIIHNVQPSRYRARISRQMVLTPCYVSSAKYGDTDLLRDPLTVEAGVAIPPIEVTLRNDPAQLTVKVEGLVPERLTRIFVLSESAPAEEPIVAPVMPKGPAPQFIVRGNFFSPRLPNDDPDSVRFRDLAPGGYKVVAIEGMPDLEYANPAALQPYLFEAAHVSLDPNGKSSVSVKVIGSGN
jgi:hypothetical protein